MSQLSNIIQKLSKSSPNAVYTPNSDFTVEEEIIFDYLYVETDIEKKYKDLLEQHKNSKVIIFLSGSSGDGKSAIIGKNQDNFKEHYHIHIDATHSFRPDQSAIEALDEVFSTYKEGTKSLVVGINMGILLNFSREGSDVHEDIKNAIRGYETETAYTEKVYFINFENYPKFQMYEQHISSRFILDLLQKISMPSLNNPFYKAYQNDLENNIRTLDHQNFYLLGLEPIQKRIVELLVTVHLKYDQFLTTRSILDLLHVLLKEPRLLIDQLFEHDSNSILENTYKEDPILYRTKRLDTFVLQRSNKRQDEELENFVYTFNKKSGFQILNVNDVHTLVRTFYLFREYDCSNNYHRRFEHDFADSSTLEYVKLIIANQNYSHDTKQTLQSFYKEIKNAIFAYANKHHPSLTKSELFQFDMINGFGVCTNLEISPVWSAIESSKEHAINNFKCYLKVHDQTIEPITITLNMYKLILAINQGYRPNKHDRNTIIIFEELLEKISKIVKTSKRLVFVKNDIKYSFRDSMDEIEVSIHD